MKPNEDYNLSYNNIEDLDYEISPLELVQDIGILILEGRLPEFSVNGRKEGHHCWPVSLHSEKRCCQENKHVQSSMCNFVKSARKKMQNIWQETMPIFIEVLVCLDNLFPHSGKEKDPCEIYFDFLPETGFQRTLLLERWKIEVHNKSSGSIPSSFVSINMLLQAIRSFLHFSQLSAWFIRTGGRIPSQLFYRIIQGEASNQLDFNSGPEIHSFPQALTSRTESITTSVFTLPRLNLETLISMSPFREYNLSIERKIWTCSHDRRISANSSQLSEADVSDSEETPIKIAEDKIDGKQVIRKSNCDIVFINEPLLHSKRKRRKEKNFEISKTLRKRLSFEKNDATNAELPHFQVSGNSHFQKNGRRLKHGIVEDFGKKNNNLSEKEHKGQENEVSKKFLLKTGKCGPNEPEKKSSHMGLDDIQEDIKKATEKLAMIESIEKEFIDRNEGDSVFCCNCVNRNHDQGENNLKPEGNTSKIMFHIGKEEEISSQFTEPQKNSDSNSRNDSLSSKLLKNVENHSLPYDSPMGASAFEQSHIHHNRSSLERTMEKRMQMLNFISNLSEGEFRKLELRNNGLSLGEQMSNGKCEEAQRENLSHKDDLTKDERNSCHKDKHQPNRCMSCVKIHEKPPEKIHRSESYSSARSRPISMVTRLSLGACTVPVFHSKTGLPVASSPAPLRRPEKAMVTEQNQNGNGKLLSPSVEIKKTRKISVEFSTHHATKILSRSAPASTRLLGNFEESVLKGRLPVFGTVEGFTAEIGASGSFCPKHVTLPIECQFFRTSDDNAPSPYMGHISFRNLKGKKGYHVPRKGTIQLTLFNPNKTVVKVFIVLYDFSDMPSNSHTFLRQKIVSIRTFPQQEEQQNLHYLVHLRFASTKHDHIYLHTDVRLIFPQQNPDVSTQKLKVLTYGPLEPRYTARDR